MGEKGAVLEVVLRDLQSLLRRTFGDQLIVEDYTTTSLIAPGENYGSTMLKVDAVIRRDEASEKEDLHLVAKMLPPTEFQRQMFRSSHSFRKEIFMYEEIIPMYNRLEIEFGAKKEEVFNILPKLYAARLSLSSEAEDFDDNAVMLMENLKVSGYSCGDRRIGYDLDHSRLAVASMARFHALGIAMKFKKPELFEQLKVRSKSIELKDEVFDDMMKFLLPKIDGHPEIRCYLSNIEKMFEDDLRKLWDSPPPEPWGTIVHSDFWVNNIMFHHDENGKPDDIKFVDFQNYIYISPQRELVFFLYSSCDEGVRSSFIEELINLYYDSFLSCLKKMDCDTTDFSRDLFDKQMKSNARLELMHCIFMLKVMTVETEEVKNAADVEEMFSHEGNKAYDERMVEVVKSFGRNDWL